MVDGIKKVASWSLSLNVTATGRASAAKPCYLGDRATEAVRTTNQSPRQRATAGGRGGQGRKPRLGPQLGGRDLDPLAGDNQPDGDQPGRGGAERGADNGQCEDRVDADERV